MFKHQDIIDKLTLEQKIALIADVSALGETEGYSFLKEADWNNPHEWKNYPSFDGLANSWNVGLIKTVGADLFAKAKESNVNLVTLPTSGVMVTPYSQGLSEDTHLSGALVGALASAGKKVGVATCLSDPRIEKTEADYLDVVPNLRTMYESIFRSHYSVLKNDVVAIKLESKSTSADYEPLNEKLINSLEEKHDIIYDKRNLRDEDKKVTVFGRLYYGASSVEIKEAYQKYTELKSQYDEGIISLADVNAECENGSAVSDDTINRTIDKILDFADTCASKTGTVEPVANAEQLILTTMSESTVMLKNDSVLPLHKNTKIALIGERAEDGEGENSLLGYFSEHCAKAGLKFVGFERGYEGKLRHEDLLASAVKRSSKADVVIVALGYSQSDNVQTHKVHNCKLPANQEELIRKIASTGKKLIVLLYGNCEFDMSFDEACQSVLLMPASNAYSAKALLSILMGKVSPGGRLKNTLYDDTDEYFTRLKNYKNAGRNDVGVFYGYKYYDTADKKVKYPFGFGLTYGNFVYSGLKIKRGKVSFIVKNSGKVTASEAVQVYVGKKDSAVIRPKKELKYFTKLTLKPGRSGKVEFKLSDMKLSVYDEENNKYVTETGKYEMYVGSSVNEIKLKGSFSIIGETLKKDNLKYNKFFQNQGNILDGNFSLEESVEVPKMPKKIRNLRFSVTLLFVDVFLSLLYMYAGYVGFVPTGLLPTILIGALAGVLLIMVAINNGKCKKIIQNRLELSKKMKLEKRTKLDVNEIYDPIPFEELFETEFADPVIDVTEESVVVEEAEVETVEEEYVFNPDLTMQKACDELSVFARERGVGIDLKSARALFSALAASKLIVFNSEDKVLLNEFLEILGKYFEYSVVTEKFDNVHAGGNDIINCIAPCYPTGITKIGEALIKDEAVENQMRLMLLTNAQTEFIRPCYAHLFKYFDQPHSKNLINVHENGTDIECVVPENVWFGIVLAEGQKVADIPAFMLEITSEVDLVLHREIPLEIFEMEKEKLEKQGTLAEAKDNQNGEDVEESENAENASEEKQETEKADEELEENVEGEGEGKEKSHEEEEMIRQATVVSQMTFYQFNKMVELALRDNNMDETLWKRVDKLEDSVNERDDTYSISSKLWRRLEKYASVYLSAGGEAEETLDNVVASQVINTMINPIANSKVKSDEKFISVVENIFGEGHVPCTVQKIKSTGLKN